MLSLAGSLQTDSSGGWLEGRGAVWQTTFVLGLHLLFHPKHQVQLVTPYNWLPQKPTAKTSPRAMDSSPVQGSEMNEVTATEEGSSTRWNHAGKLGRAVRTGHSAFVVCASLPVTEVNWNFFNTVSQGKHGGLWINISTLPGTTQETNSSFYQVPRWEGLRLGRAQHRCPGEPRFVRTQQLRFCCSLRFDPKQSLFRFRQSLSGYDTEIRVRIFLFMQWLTYRKSYNWNALSSWPLFLLFTNTMMLPSNIFFFFYTLASFLLLLGSACLLSIWKWATEGYCVQPISLSCSIQSFNRNLIKVVLLQVRNAQVFFSSTATVWQTIMQDFFSSLHPQSTGPWTCEVSSCSRQGPTLPQLLAGDTLLASGLLPELRASSTLLVVCSPHGPASAHYRLALLEALYQ